MSEKHSLTRFFPTYIKAQRFLLILEGTRYSQYVAMWRSITNQKGTPQDTANWTKPQEWIPQRLDDEEQELALRIWHESDHLVNPRYTDGIISLTKKHELADYTNTIAITELGRKFLGNDKDTLKTIDEYEGVLAILASVMASGPSQRKVLFDRFRVFCMTNTNSKSDTFVFSQLDFRLKNLLQRKLIEKNGQSYQITIEGLDWLAFQNEQPKNVQTYEVASPHVPLPPDEPNVAIARLAMRNEKTVRKQLAEYLRQMDPFRFEHLIKRLLEEMGYENVEVTTATNDKGVDVVGEIELGISRVREVIQAKRQQSNVGRGVLDSLRGSLYRFDAVRGTIITTSGFSKGAQGEAFAKGQAPITLIDGERLISLLIEHNIGIRRREIRILEFDKEDLNQFESDIESDALSPPRSPNS